jgi:serine/threonine-protein kinase HipA
MTTFEAEPNVAYVWVWLPHATKPVSAGVLELSGGIVRFTYGRSYLEREEAIPLYLPELPLQRGRQRPIDGLTMAGCISDAAPDAWGKRVIRYRMLGSASDETETYDLNALSYLLHSGTDRIGALDFQVSPDVYEPRNAFATLSEMQEAAERLEAGVPFSTELDVALLHGSSVGGARPKALLDDNGKKLIAKFSSRTDPYPVVKSEGAAMELASRVGLNVARSEVVECMGRDVLLVERFDRDPLVDDRRLVISALTLLGLDEMLARYATYFDLVPMIQQRFTNAPQTLRELFSRIVFNICVGNTDDHARNHSAFWDGSQLTLTPAYDIGPQLRGGGEAVQAMQIAPGFRFSNLVGVIDVAETYFLSRSEARDIVVNQIDIIRAQWEDVADRARLSLSDRQQLWHRQFLNPYATEGL